MDGAIQQELRAAIPIGSLSQQELPTTAAKHLFRSLRGAREEARYDPLVEPLSLVWGQPRGRRRPEFTQRSARTRQDAVDRRGVGHVSNRARVSAAVRTQADVDEEHPVVERRLQYL